MANFSTKDFDPIDYCIELSRMLEEREDDQGKMSKLFGELLAMYGGPEFIEKYAKENDRILEAFCWSVSTLAQSHKLSIERSLQYCYEIHGEMAADDMFISPDDDEKEVKRKETVAKKIYQRVIHGAGPNAEKTRRRSFFARVAGLFRKNGDVPLI